MVQALGLVDQSSLSRSDKRLVKRKTNNRADQAKAARSGGNQCRDPLGIAAQNAVTHTHHLGKVMNSVQAESTRPSPGAFPKISSLGQKIQSKLDLKLFPCSRAAYRRLSHHFRNSSSATLGNVHISQPLCSREHAAERNGAFDPVSIVRIGIDSVEALQELLQKCFRSLSENQFCCGSVGKGLATGCEFKTRL